MTTGKQLFEHIWAEPLRESDGITTVRIGLNESTIQHIQEECYSILARRRKIIRGSPMFSIEMDYGLECVTSPFDGHIVDISNVVLDCPEKITADTTIMLLQVKTSAMPQL